MLEIQNRNNIVLGKVTDIHTQYPEFWEAYCKFIEKDIKISKVKSLEPHIRRSNNLFWFSGGLESTVVKHMLDKKKISYHMTNIQENKDFFREAIKEDLTYEFIFARIGEKLSYKQIIVGIEDDALWKPALSRNYYTKFEMDNFFFDMWNTHRVARLISPVGLMHKDEVLCYAIAHNLKFSSCDFEEKTHCGECYKCFELWCYYTAIGEKPLFSISKKCYDLFLNEWKEYKNSSYKAEFNPYGSLQRYIRLRVIYGFDLNEISL
jgi:7-cyano-7-deazaguanine synthase in queuosine biosynthesis